MESEIGVKVVRWCSRFFGICGWFWGLAVVFLVVGRFSQLICFWSSKRHRKRVGHIVFVPMAQSTDFRIDFFSTLGSGQKGVFFLKFH